MPPPSGRVQVRSRLPTCIWLLPRTATVVNAGSIGPSTTSQFVASAPNRLYR